MSWSCISFSQINAFTSYSLKLILPTLDDYLPFSPFTHIPLLTINHPPSSQQLTFWFLPRGLQTEVFFSQIYTLTANSGVSSLVVVCRETEARDVGGSQKGRSVRNKSRVCRAGFQACLCPLADILPLLCLSSSPSIEELDDVNLNFLPAQLQPTPYIVPTALTTYFTWGYRSLHTCKEKLGLRAGRGGTP